MNTSKVMAAMNGNAAKKMQALVYQAIVGNTTGQGGIPLAQIDPKKGIKTMTNGKVMFAAIDQLKRIFALNWMAWIPTCVVGSVGTGKTSEAEEFIKELDGNSEETYHQWKILPSVMEPSDFGVPYPQDGKLAHLAPTFLPFNCQDKGVMIVDEFDRAKPDVQNTFLQILLGGNIHGNVISPNAYTIMTMNGASDMYTTPLSEAARTRVCSIFVSTHATGNLDGWDEWAENNEINTATRGFVKFRPELLEAKEDFEELALPNPRTIAMASKIMDAADEASFRTDDILPLCLAGVVGKAVAIEMMAYKEMVDKCPDVDDIIANPEKAQMPTDQSVLYAIGLALVSKVSGDEDQETAKAVVQYAARMPEEFTAFVLRKLGGKCPRIHTTKDYMKWAEEHKMIIM